MKPSVFQRNSKQNKLSETGSRSINNSKHRNLSTYLPPLSRYNNKNKAKTRIVVFSSVLQRSSNNKRVKECGGGVIKRLLEDRNRLLQRQKCRERMEEREGEEE